MTQVTPKPNSITKTGMIKFSNQQNLHPKTDRFYFNLINHPRFNEVL